MKTLGRTLLTAALAACGESAPPPLPEPPVEEWPLEATPRRVIPSESAPAGHEFGGVFGVRRLSNGNLLVANSSSSSLILFDSSGQPLRVIGRKGEGPGEFLDPLYLFGAADDSLAVFDGGNIRWSVLTPDGNIARTLPPTDSSIRRPTWLYQGAIIQNSSVLPPSGFVVHILDSLGKTEPDRPGLVTARVDDAGRLWIKRPDHPTRWRIYHEAGVAQADLPARFTLLQGGTDFVLGTVLDSSDVEQIVLYGLKGRPFQASLRATGSDSLPAVPPQDANLLVQLPKLIWAQEVYYSDHGRYADLPDSLAFPIKRIGRVFLLYGSERRWAAVAVGANGATCGVAVGFPAPAGWVDGTPFCGW